MNVDELEKSTLKTLVKADESEREVPDIEAPNSSSQSVEVGNSGIKLSDITVESIKRTQIQDGDVVVVTLPPLHIPHSEVNKLLSSSKKKMEAFLIEAGYKCAVLVLANGVSVDVLTKAALEEKLGEVKES